MTEEQIEQFAQMLNTWCWHHDFHQFCEVTGFTGDYAEHKWMTLKNLWAALNEFDAATLARIINSDH